MIAPPHAPVSFGYGCADSPWGLEAGGKHDGVGRIRPAPVVPVSTAVPVSLVALT